MKNKQLAILLMLLSSLNFSIMQTAVKLAENIPVIEKVLFRNFISLIIMFFIIKKNNFSYFGKKENQKYLIGRSVFGFLGVVAFFYATNNLILSDAAILNKLSPFFVTIFAFFLLKEKLSKVQVPALIIAFIGACLVIKPQFTFEAIPAFSGLLSAILAGAAYTLVRYLGDKEEASTIVFYFSFVSVVCSIPFVITTFVMPTFYEFILLLGIGIFAATGQITLTYAYKYAPASEISIFSYSNIIFSSILGYLVFSEISDYLSIIGGLLIIVSSYIVFLYNKKTHIS